MQLTIHMETTSYYDIESIESNLREEAQEQLFDCHSDPIFTAYIGNLEFDIDELEEYSTTTKEFLEDIMDEDDHNKLVLFHTFANSEQKHLLNEEDIDLDVLIYI